MSHWTSTAGCNWPTWQVWWRPFRNLKWLWYPTGTKGTFGRCTLKNAIYLPEHLFGQTVVSFYWRGSLHPSLRSPRHCSFCSIISKKKSWPLVVSVHLNWTIGLNKMFDQVITLKYGQIKYKYIVSDRDYVTSRFVSHFPGSINQENMVFHPLDFWQWCLSLHLFVFTWPKHPIKGEGDHLGDRKTGRREINTVIAGRIAKWYVMKAKGCSHDTLKRTWRGKSWLFWPWTPLDRTLDQIQGESQRQQSQTQRKICHCAQLVPWRKALNAKLQVTKTS